MVKETFQTFLKLVLIENDGHLLHLLYKLSNYQLEKVFNMCLMCPVYPIVI